MDSSGGDKDGDGSTEASSATGGLHDHSDLLIPNPSFTSSVSFPGDDLGKHYQMDCQMTSPQPVSSSEFNNLEFTMPQQSQSNPSPPNVIVDDSPLQPCMDRNKESLKVKLLMRRPMNQLVEQGILPPPKTPAAFAGQRVRLERARMGDLLKAKIQQRPARQELIRQHILEDTDSRVAPSLAEKQRMLKRARLADSLNDHLIHRPGPLELVQKNILHAPDADIEKAIKEGIVSFKATSEGHVPGPSLPNKYTNNEDDSSSDISSPAGTPDTSSSGHTTEASTPITKQPSDPAIVPPSTEPCEVTLQPAKTNKSETTQIILTTTTTAAPTPPAPPLVPPQTVTPSLPSLTLATATPTTTATIFQVAAPLPQQHQPPVTAVIPPPPPLPQSLNTPQTIVLPDGVVRGLLPQLQSAGFQLSVQNAASLVSAASKPSLISQSSSSSSSTLGKSRSSKKSSKSKSQPKARMIKFHEYKGPSSCQQKGSSSSSTNLAQSKAESSYELLLKQQQLFLQWQLEWQHKYPQILLPAAPKLQMPTGKTANANATCSVAATALMSSYPVTTLPATLCTTLINNQQQPSSQQTNFAVTTTTINASPKPIALTLAPKSSGVEVVTPVSSVTSIIVPKLSTAETSEQSKLLNENFSSPSSASESSSKNEKSIKPINLNEWKVSDLKTELKKRSLPVSGSKMQLVERLKAAAANEANKISSSGNKMDVADESSSEGMMETSNNVDEGSRVNKAVPSPAPTENNNVTAAINNNISFLDLASGKLHGVPISLQNILDLLGLSVSGANNVNEANGTTPGVVVTNNNVADLNNLKNATTTSNVINQLPISAVAVNPPESSKYIDETTILEQQKQILELQKALRISQQQLAQQKDPKNGGPQKHRLVLQQHIHHRLQQQKIQNELQNLIQLQSQQAEQKKQQQLLQQQQAQQQPAQLVLISNEANANNHQVPQPQTIAGIANNILNISDSSPLTTLSQKERVQPKSENVECLNNGSRNLDHQESWLQANNSNETENKSLDFEDLVQTISHNTRDIQKHEPVESNTGSRSHQHHDVKSQMVDDVLEILIRNGELPPSAAQNPQGKSGSSSASSDTASSADNRTNDHDRNAVVPPPPPLPPPSFSVMLPTTIPFSKHSHTNTDFITSTSFSGAVRTDNTLSKDAQEILRICEDLSNFGKSREAEVARLEEARQNNNKHQQVNDQHANFHTTSSSMDCGFFTDGKEFDLGDSMDVGYDDTHSVSLHSTSSQSQPKNHQYHLNSSHQPNFGLLLNSSSEKLDSGTDGHGSFSFGNSQQQQHDQQNHASISLKPSQRDHHHNFMNDDELLPDPLDMPMDTDYSDWLDTFLPVNNDGSTTSSSNNTGGAPSSTTSSISTSTPNLFHADVSSKNNSGKRQLGEQQLNNNNSSTTALFSSLFEDHQNLQPHHNQQRDPLLSSRSFSRITLPFGSGGQQLLPHQPSNFHLAHQHTHLQQTNGSSPFLIHSTSSATSTLMDTDFDELSASLATNKKSDPSSANNCNITEMPCNTTSTAPPITTNSMNDNFLWDFAM